MSPVLENLKRELEAAIAGMSDEQLGWRTGNKWSAAEVLEHLYLTYTGTIKGFERLVLAGKPSATPASIKHRMRVLVVLVFGYLPSGREAPAGTRPKGLSIGQVRDELGKKISAMDDIIAQCEARFGRNARLLDHPVLGPLTARQWRKFHLLHGRLHRKQILQLRRQMSQPKSLTARVPA